MIKVINIKYILFLLVCTLAPLSGCGGGGGSGSSANQPASLELGIPVRNGNSVTLPLTLTNTQGLSISGIEAYISFDPKAFALITNGSSLASATPGEAAVLAGKSVYQSKSPTQSSVLHLVIIDLGGKNNISTGVVAQIRFEVVPNAPSGDYTFSIASDATDANGVPTSVPVTKPTVRFSL